jgi:Trp operon repressor
MAEETPSEDNIRKSPEYKKRLDEARAAKQVAKDLAAEEKKIENSLVNQVKSQTGLNKLFEEAKFSAQNITKAVISANKSQVQFQKSLGLSVSDSTKLTRQIASSATFSRNIGVSFVGTQKAITNINKSLGTGTKLVEEQAEAAGRFALTLGMSEEAQNNIAQVSIQTGKSFEDIVLSQVGIVKGVESELGARLNIAEVINEAASISGQMRAQMGGNVAEITRAVAVAKELGFELKAMAATSKALLDFQSNIEAELEAELLTGKQLNLEQARLYALTGDYEGLTREIKNNVGDFYEFSKLNVLQQDAIAKSVGMTSDSLSDALFKEESISELKERARAEGDKETLANLERLDIQKQFAQITLKIQSAFISFATYLEPVFQGFALLAENADIVLGAMAGIAAYSTVIAIQQGIITGEIIMQKIAMIQAAAARIIGAAIANPVAAIAGLVVGGLAVSYMRSETKKRAIGGPIAAGQPYMVGERGPELIVPPNSGTVVPNNQLTTNTNNQNKRSDTEIIALATKAAARSISVDFNSIRFNSNNSVDTTFA